MLFGFLLSDGDTHFGNQRSLQKLNYGGCTLNKTFGRTGQKFKAVRFSKKKCVGQRSGGDDGAWCVFFFLAFRW